MSFYLNSEIRDIVNKSVFLTGSTRSGTTMFSQLVNSLAGVENFFEHPFNYLHMYLMDQLPEAVWRLQFEAFLVEELMIQRWCGRNINFNKNDESYTLRGRSVEEIEARLAQTWRRQDALLEVMERRLVFKMPEMLPRLNLLRQYYPEMTFVVMLRRPHSVIASLLKKGWYSDKQMVSIGGEWLFQKKDDKFLPPWLPEDRFDEYISIAEVDRAAMCYIIQYEALIDRHDCVIVDYDRLVKEPKTYFRTVCDRIGCTYGPLTESLLDGVCEPAKDRQIALDQIAPERRQKLNEIYESCRSLAV